MVCFRNFRQRAKTEALRKTQFTAVVAPATITSGSLSEQPPVVVSSRRNTIDKENNISMPEFIHKIRSRSISKDQAYDLVLPQFVDPESGDVKLMEQQDHSMDSKMEEEEGIEVIQC